MQPKQKAVVISVAFFQGRMKLPNFVVTNQKKKCYEPPMQRVSDFKDFLYNVVA